MENMIELVKYANKMLDQQKEVGELLNRVIAQNNELKEENQELKYSLDKMSNQYKGAIEDIVKYNEENERLKSDLCVLKANIKVKDIIIKDNYNEIMHLKDLRDNLFNLIDKYNRK